MSDKPKDMNYYLAHPDEMPTDTKIIEQLAEDMRKSTMESGQEEVSVDRFSVTDPVAKDERTGASSDAEAAKKEADAKALAESNAKIEAEAKATAALEAEKKPEGVLAKDGKNIIPFAVLANARERAEASERLVQELAVKIEGLQAAAKAGKPVEQQTEMLSDDELNALAEDSPTLAKVLRAQQSTIQQLTGTVESLAQRSQAQEQVAEAEVKTEVQSAVDANPTLLAWQNDKDQTTWERASSFDKLLRETPEYRDVPFAKRFDKVVALTKAALDLKDDVQVDQNDQALTQAEIRAAAEAKLKSTKALPTSLSQIPGGASPAVDEKERVDQASPVELGQKFMGMKSVEEINAYLSTL
jgi:hypothetical protein